MIKRNTQQGNIILDVIKKAERPLTPIEIHQKAILKSPRIGIATTYRHLKVLSEGNQVVGVDYPGQPPRYEWADGKDKVHFSCRSCDKLFALDDTTEDNPPAKAPSGYHSSGLRGYAVWCLPGVRVIFLEIVSQSSICIHAKGWIPVYLFVFFIKNIIDSRENL